MPPGFDGCIATYLTAQETHSALVAGIWDRLVAAVGATGELEPEQSDGVTEESG